MAHQPGTTNFVIQNSNGQPQMIKFVQSAGKPISGIVASTTAAAASGAAGIRLYKSPAVAAADSPSQSFVSGQQVIRTQKLITKAVPIHVGSPTMAKAVPKTIRLTPTQMQNFKFINAANQKIQLAPAASIISAATVASVQQGLQQVTAAATTPQKAPPILSRKHQRFSGPTGGGGDPLELEFAPDSKRSRKSEKVSKGLRHFSMKVCEKVKQKGTTSYNEVADELVTEFTNSTSQFAAEYDQKNIRRRVYDALNVLMAMNIISKEKKEIRWIGLPTNSLQECQQLEKEMQKKMKSIREKEKQLSKLILNQIAFKNLAQRNRESERMHGAPAPNSFIQLPFIVVNTNKKTVINCSISNDKMEYLFQFSDKFEINDDVEILKSIGMLEGLNTGECTPENLAKLKSLVPESLWPYVDKIATNSASNPNQLDEMLLSGGAGAAAAAVGAAAAASSGSMFSLDDFVEVTMDDTSRQSSSYDPLSPGGADYSEEDIDSDLSSDTDLNG